MMKVGDRIRLSSGKAPDREGVVSAVMGLMVRVRWPSGGETTVIPAPGTLTVLASSGAQTPPAAVRALRTKAKKAAPTKAAQTGAKKAASTKTTGATKAATSKKAASTKTTGATKAAASKKAASTKTTGATKAAASKKAASTKTTGATKAAASKKAASKRSTGKRSSR